MISRTISLGLLICSFVCVSLACASRSMPMVPVTMQQIMAESGAISLQQFQTHLWGLYQVYIDADKQTATAVPSRGAMYAVNVVSLLNAKPANLSIIVNLLKVAGGNCDADLDITISHPFQNQPEYNGYDVRGIFIGNGSVTMSYNSALKTSAHSSSDQEMFDYNQYPAFDPHEEEIGHPDGYTRWWNQVEFHNPGIFGYTPGVRAIPGYTGTATLNPYKYFADGLDVDGDLWEFLTTTSNHGVFASGSENTRNYYIRFPIPAPGLAFSYAVVANWAGRGAGPDGIGHPRA
jgi:hypothetical protein